MKRLSLNHKIYFALLILMYLSISIIVFISFPFCLEMIFFELIVYIFLGLPIVLSYVNLDWFGSKPIDLNFNIV